MRINDLFVNVYFFFKNMIKAVILGLVLAFTLSAIAESLTLFQIVVVTVLAYLAWIHSPVDIKNALEESVISKIEGGIKSVPKPYHIVTKIVAYPIVIWMGLGGILPGVTHTSPDFPGVVCKSMDSRDGIIILSHCSDKSIITTQRVKTVYPFSSRPERD